MNLYILYYVTRLTNGLRRVHDVLFLWPIVAVRSLRGPAPCRQRLAGEFIDVKGRGLLLFF